LSGLLQSPPDPPSKLYWWPVAAFVAIAGGWLVWRTWQITGRRLPLAIFTAVGTVLIVGAVALGSNLTAKGPIDWVYYTPQRFEQELEEGNVIVLDFTAEWCLNCKTLEHTQLHQDKVVGLLAEQGVVPMKVDITGHNPQGRAKLKSAGRLTIPLLVVYAPDGSEVFKSDAYHAGEVVAAVNEARGERVAGRR